MSKVGDGWQKKYPSMENQAEYFLLKFAKDDDIHREEVMTLMIQFKKYAKPNKGELEEDEAMRLLEARNQTKTFKELRQMVSEIDIDKNRMLSFLEWACAIYNKSWEKLHAPSVDPEEVARAEALVKKAAEEEEARRRAEDEARKHEDEKRILELKAAQERAAADHNADAAANAKKALDAELARQAEELRARHADEAARKAAKDAEEASRRAGELKRQGVAGKVALFKYAAHDSKDSTSNNKAKIQDEVSKKKAIKQQELEAMAKKKIADEEIAQKKAEAEEAAVKAAKAKEEAEHAAAIKAQKEAERIEAERKTAEAEVERKRTEELSDKKLRDAHEMKKRETEEKARKIKEEEEKKRAAGRALLASKASAFGDNSAKAVVSSINDKQNLKSASTKEKSGLDQVKLLGEIRKGTDLNKMPGDNKTASEELTDDAKADFIVDQIKKRNSTVGGQGGIPGFTAQ